MYRVLGPAYNLRTKAANFAVAFEPYILANTSIFMSDLSPELEERRIVALAAIKRAFGTPADEHAATLFVAHHLEELPAEYWLEHCENSQPEPQQVLELLVLRVDEADEDDEDDDIDLNMLDFTLPGDVTDYVICVELDDAGAVESISMES